MRVLLLVGCLFLAGCGYVGDPLPPALNIPVKIADLRAVQKGGTIMVDFTAPSTTTEALGLRELQSIDVRIGQPDAWPDAARPIPAATPEPAAAVHLEIPSRDWVNQEVVVGVRAKGPKGRLSEWSDLIRFRVTEPLTPPESVQAEPHPDGIRISWARKSGLRYRVFRQTEGETEVSELAAVDAAEYVDRDARAGIKNTYTVQTVVGRSESPVSSAVAAIRADIFAPAAPAGLTALAGVTSIELAWNRSTEPDFRSYRVYRSSGPGPMAVLADAVQGPAYSDRQVAAGTKYTYAVTAVDQASNESQRSSNIEIIAPSGAP